MLYSNNEFELLLFLFDLEEFSSSFSEEFSSSFYDEFSSSFSEFMFFELFFSFFMIFLSLLLFILELLLEDELFSLSDSSLDILKMINN
jgi:hypothetical protein